MATLKEAKKILKRVKKLKRDFVKIQEYQNAAAMRDIEQRLDKRMLKGEYIDSEDSDIKPQI